MIFSYPLSVLFVSFLLRVILISSPRVRQFPRVRIFSCFLRLLLFLPLRFAIYLPPPLLSSVLFLHLLSVCVVSSLLGALFFAFVFSSSSQASSSSPHLCYSEFFSSLFFFSSLCCDCLRLSSSFSSCSSLLFCVLLFVFSRLHGLLSLSPCLPIALYVIFSLSSFSSCSPPTFHRSGPLHKLTTDETRTLFLRISGSRFLSPSQHLRWCAAPNARCCGGQGLPPSTSGRLDGPVLTGTRRRANTCWNPSCSQARWNSTGGPVIFRKPLRRRSAAATSG